MTTIASPPTSLPGVPVPRPGAMRACLFVLGGQRFAVEVAVARGVVVLDDVTFVPGAPAHVLGIANLRGSLVPVLDVRRHLRLAAPWRDGPLKALLTEHDSMQVAIALDTVIGLESFDDALPLGAVERTRYGDFAVARLPGPGGDFTLLDAPRIIDTLRIRGLSADDAAGATLTGRTSKDV
jgi:chemotaxis signal transduction protein